MNVPKPILKLLLQFAPQIVDFFYPKVCKALDSIVESAELQDGEDYARIILAKDHNGWTAFVVAMSDEDQILRVISKKNIQEAVSQIMDMKEKLKDIEL